MTFLGGLIWLVQIWSPLDSKLFLNPNVTLKVAIMNEIIWTNTLLEIETFYDLYVCYLAKWQNHSCMSSDRLMVTHSNCLLMSEKKIIDYDLCWLIAWVIRQSCTNNVWLCDQPLVISIDCRLKRILQLQFKVFVWISLKTHQISQEFLE